MANMILGPVVGKVTHSTARVLVEADDNAEITCSAIDSGGHTVTDKRSFTKGIPSVFTLSGLNPRTEYQLSLQGADGARGGRIRTLAEKPDRMNIAAVSCNFTVNRGATDLWVDLRDRYVRPGDVDLLIHVGDQIYGDNAYGKALDILRGRNRVNKNKEGKILELYRALYRYTWNHPPTQEVLATTPNLMIWDDHEIRDDWGSIETDRDSESPQSYVGRLARRVYREYQRQLWDDVDGSAMPASGFEHHFHVWGEIGILFVDQRGGRSFQYDPQRPYLGTPQWEEILRALSPGGLLSTVRALVVVTSVPLVFLSSDNSTLGSRVVDDLRDQWAYSPHRKEQIEFIRALRQWKQDRPDEREVLVVGGDVHVGAKTEIRHLSSVIFRQLITSPITNVPPKWYEFFGIQVLAEAHETIGEHYSFEHSNLTRNRNFGIIIVRLPQQGLARIEGSLVEAVDE